ncbi:MAG: hypothetical protein Q9157_002763 [Trypethelium eluteriae]
MTPRPLRWAVVIHGGCTNTLFDPEVQRDIQDNLATILGTVELALKEGVQAKDVVVKTISALEDCPLFNAGKGAAFTLDGGHELEAGLVDGHSGSYGAVSCLTVTKNPILAADAVLYRGNHCMIAGSAADDLSRKLGLEIVPNTYFSTISRRAFWEANIRIGHQRTAWEAGTVGVIALDSHGHIAVGGSTGGISGKDSGRVGDTAVLGAGLFADSKLGVACSGAGDEIFRHLLATKVTSHHSHGLSLEAATHKALSQISLTVLPQHIFYSDSHLSAGLSQFPTTQGQSTAVLKHSAPSLFSLEQADFLRAMITIKSLQQKLRAFYGVNRCALITEGNHPISMIPLHGLSEEWKPVIGNANEFHEEFPGYITSKDGPEMDKDRQEQIAFSIRAEIGLEEPFNYQFQGEKHDSNLFARLVRGELPQSRIWETDEHVAFLTPFGNTPGFTVLVPRAHLTSDIFSIDDNAYLKLLAAAHTVGRHLISAFHVSRCGMIFEGFEIDYAHIKLVPIHETHLLNVKLITTTVVQEASFEETYQGYITSLNGPLCKDIESLSADASSIRRTILSARAKAPRSWVSPVDHAAAVLTEPWYSNLFAAQDSLFHSSVNFFKHRLNYKYTFVPATTDAISSPMGLGSDSVPVPINFLGQDTHLADSMQFALEYSLRIADDSPGVYYISTSFRGEDPDAMHLNQFHHVECELIGDFQKGISVAEKYLVSVISAMTRDLCGPIQMPAGSIDHLDAFLELHRSNSGKLPQITVEEALSLPQMDHTCWKHAVQGDPKHGHCITRAGEVKLIEHFGGAVWLTEMDHLSVPFYQAYVEGSLDKKARCADLLLGNGEVLGLGERHVHASDVLRALDQHKVPTEPYTWYSEMRETKPIQTTG